MKEEPKCQYRIKGNRGHMNICQLGLYGGRVTDGGCRDCIKKGQNNPEYKKELFARAERSHPSTAKRVSGCCDSARNYID
jgi:hypothetical protein